ncbi:MAG: nucleotidyltransferase family protein [Atopobiaceae bacterium]|nr:nucleotidyltransferase family protein [Atopobiaceae bacterium]
MGYPLKDMNGDQLEDLVFDSLLSERDKTVLRLLFSEDGGTEEDIRFLTEGLDVETESMYFMLLLAAHGFRIQWRHFPEGIIPRLKGIHRYHQAHNLMGLPWLLEKVRLLQGAGIPVMLIKGLAVRLHYAPDIPRIMNDYDIAVPGDRFDEAIALLQDRDVSVKDTFRNSDAFFLESPVGKIELDLHRWIFKRMDIPEDEIWERAIPITVRGVDMLVMSPEDMLVHQFDTSSRTFITSELMENHVKAFVDMHSILDTAQPDPDETVRVIHRFRVEHSARMMASQYVRIFSDEQPAIQRVLDELRPVGSYAEWLRLAIEFREETRWRYVRGLRGGTSYTLTPKRLVRAIVRSYKEYRFYKLWYRGEKRVSSYPAYILWSRRIKSFSDLYERFISRISPVEEEDAVDGGEVS